MNEGQRQAEGLFDIKRGRREARWPLPCKDLPRLRIAVIHSSSSAGMEVSEGKGKSGNEKGALIV